MATRPPNQGGSSWVETRAWRTHPNVTRLCWQAISLSLLSPRHVRVFQPGSAVPFRVIGKLTAPAGLGSFHLQAMNYLVLDCETFLISEAAIAPELVCVTFCSSTGEEYLATPWDDPDLEDYLRESFEDEDFTIIGANIAFDCLVLLKRYPGLLPSILKAYREDRIYDVQINERLNNLKSAGSVMMIERPDGSFENADYSLAALEVKYVGIDRRELKKGDDVWRLNYHRLFEVPKADWPGDAIDYAMDDARTPLEIHRLQQPHPQDAHRARQAFALLNFTDVGLKVDPDAVFDLDEKVEAAMATTNFPELLEVGIVVPEQEARPYANGAQEHVPGCEGKGQCMCPPKMTAPKKAKMSRKVLRDAVYAECEEYGVEIPLTDKGKVRYYAENERKVKSLVAEHDWWTENPDTIGTSSGTVAALAALGSSAMRELEARNEYAKLASTYLPSVVIEEEDGEIRIADRLRFPFNVLVETGRTSSRTSRLFPSTNGQNADPRFRPCLIADKGEVICSVDYGQLELRTLADFCYEEFGFSVARELFIDGVDLHAYLGAQLAFDIDQDFHDVCMEEYGEGNRRGYYEAFMEMKEHDPKWFKHYRTFAKPVGLGYPGGLGPETLVELAWASYGFEMTIELAKHGREVWLSTYPEMRKYFEHIREDCIDPDHSKTDPITGEIKKTFKYETPLGLTRVNCSYTAASNGLGMQSRAADGTMLAIWQVFEECYTEGSPLWGCRPVDFIHDEILLLIPYDADPAWATRAGLRVAEIMCEAMGVVIENVPITAEPAFMRRWLKEAEPVWDGEILIPWEPSHETP